MTIVYDTGALLAIERRDRRMTSYHDRAVGLLGETPVVPVVVLAQAWRGGPQPLLSRFLSECEILPDDEGIGRLAGKLCATSRTSDVVDAIVVATALAFKANNVITSDPRDLASLAATAGHRLPIVVI